MTAKAINKEFVQRMYLAATGRLHDAEVLAQSGREASDSSAILSILGLEILLKCALVLSGFTRPHGHEYRTLWNQLPLDLREQVLGVAALRMPGHANLQNIDRVLNGYEFVFKKGRYYYEIYSGWTNQEVRDYGELWIQLGAPEDEAEMQYYPNELTCLVAGLRTWIEAQLNGSQ